MLPSNPNPPNCNMACGKNLQKTLFAPGYPTHAICEGYICRITRRYVILKKKNQMCWTTSAKEIKRQLGLKIWTDDPNKWLAVTITLTLISMLPSNGNPNPPTCTMACGENLQKTLFAPGYPTHAICEGYICRITRRYVILKKTQMCWTTSAKEIKRQLGLKTCIRRQHRHSLLGCFVIARSSREDIDLEEVIGTHEFACTNRALMQPDGSLHTTTELYSDPPAGEHKADWCEHGTERYYPYLYEELQERQSPRHIIMLSRSNQKLKAIYKWGLSLINTAMCPQSSQQQGNVAEASPRERDPIYWYFSVEDGTCIRKNTYFFPVMTQNIHSLCTWLNNSSIIIMLRTWWPWATEMSLQTREVMSCSTGVNTKEEVDTIMILHAV